MTECQYCGGDHDWQRCPRISEIIYHENRYLASVRMRDLRELAYRDWIESLTPEQRAAHLWSSFDPKFAVEATVRADWMDRVVEASLPRATAWKLLEAVVNKNSFVCALDGVLLSPGAWALQTNCEDAVEILGVPEKQMEQVTDVILAWRRDYLDRQLADHRNSDQ